MEQNPDPRRMSEEVVEAMRFNSSTPNSHRPGHARGRLLRGHFIPSSIAATLSSAPHFNNSRTPVLIRLSSATGKPYISDTDPTAQPRGLALRFLLPDDNQTDIIAHSTPCFPMPTVEGFLAFQLARRDKDAMATFLVNNPSAQRFVEVPKKPPKSFGTERYYGLVAYRLVNRRDPGSSVMIRYEFEPTNGVHYWDAHEVKQLPDDYLYQDLVSGSTAEKFRFKLIGQVATMSDCTNDVTQKWPSDRMKVELGDIIADSVLSEEESDSQQRQLMFDPMPGVDGIEPSADPLIRARSEAYLHSLSIRRAAKTSEV